MHRITEIVPLDLQEIQKPLGPGYTVGSYAWEGLKGSDRISNCELTAINKTFISSFKKKYNALEKQIKSGNKSLPLEKFGKKLFYYHPKGHNIISKACSPIYNPKTSKGTGVMAFAETSARDPIFYRWHLHLEDIIRKFKNTKYHLYV